MSFSKNPKTRQLRKALKSKEEEVQILRTTLDKCSSQASNAEQTTPQLLPTPQRAAVELLNSVDVTPRLDRIQALLPLTETMSRVRKAPSKIKKSLFVEKGSSRGITKALSRHVAISRMSIFRKRSARNLRRSLVAKSQRAMVIKFMQQPDNSYEFASKKDHVRGTGSFGLTDTLENLHRKYSSQFPEVKMSLAVFCRARPPNIHLIKYTQRRQCLCQRHANVALMVDAVKVLPLSPQLLIAMTDMEIRGKLEGLSMTDVRYRTWKAQEIEHKGRVFKKVKLTQVVENAREFTDKFISGMAEFRDHCQRITTQYVQIHTLKQSMAEKIKATVQMDCAENWVCKYQDEITAVYYDKNQVTIHPMVVHFNQEGNLSAHSYVGITSVTDHSVPTTFCFIKALMTKIKEILPELSTLHFITDSPSSQYRNRTICAIVAKFPTLFNVLASWTWLEAGHGKGPCDGVGGGMKKKADNLVKARTIITNSQEFCRALSSSETIMDILEVSPETIQDGKNEIAKWNVAAVHGIMSAHAVIPGPVLKIRNTSCFKACCYTKGGVFHPTCCGWECTNIVGEVLDDGLVGGGIVDDREIDELSVNELVNSTVLHGREVVNVLQGNREVVNVLECGIEIEGETDESEVVEGKKREIVDDGQAMPTVGIHLAIDYGRRWYLGKVVEVVGHEYLVAFMTPCRGKWKWGQNDQGMVEKEDILMVVSSPEPVGMLLDIPAVETQQVQAIFNMLNQ